MKRDHPVSLQIFLTTLGPKCTEFSILMHYITGEVIKFFLLSNSKAQRAPPIENTDWCTKRIAVLLTLAKCSNKPKCLILSNRRFLVLKFLSSHFYLVFCPFQTPLSLSLTVTDAICRSEGKRNRRNADSRLRGPLVIWISKRSFFPPGLPGPSTITLSLILDAN